MLVVRLPVGLQAACLPVFRRAWPSFFRVASLAAEPIRRWSTGRAVVKVAVPSATESRRVFGVDVAKHGIQPVWLRIENRSPGSLRLQMVNIDPRYFTPLEAAGVNHFSIFRRLSAFGAIGWVFLPLLGLVPLKLVTAWLNNARMDDFFRAHGFRLGPIAPAYISPTERPS